MKYPPGSQSGRQARRREASRSAPRRTRSSPTREKRSLYDRFGHAGVSSAAGGGAGFDPSVFSEFGDFADILGNMFGFGDLFGGGRRRGGPQRGADLRYDLEISFEESAHGRRDDRSRFRARRPARRAAARARRRARRRHVCPQCQRPGPGALPAGLLHRRAHLPAVPRRRQDHREAVPDVPRRRPRRARAEDHGQDSRRHRHRPAAAAAGRRRSAASAGGPAGHLYVVVHVQEHEFFRRDGMNLFCEIPVNFTTRRARRRNPGADARRHRDASRCRKARRPARRCGCAARGCPTSTAAARGDLFATVQVQTPKKLTKEQRQLLEQLAKALPKEKFEPRAARRRAGRAQPVRPRQGHVRVD